MSRLRIAVALTLTFALVLVAAPPLGAEDGSAGWTPEGGASITQTTMSSFDSDGEATEVTSGGPRSGVAIEVSSGPGPHTAVVAVRGTPSTAGKIVRLWIEDAGGDNAPSVPVHLTPWWQTLGVTATTVGGAFRVVLREQGGGRWAPGDTYLVDALDVRAEGATVAETSGRQLLVDGEPYTMRGYYYAPTPPGGTLQALTWNTNPVQCQTDAQLMRAGGVNTLRIWYQEGTYDEESYRLCMDAFHAAGVKLMWLVQPPGGGQVQEQGDAYVEAYWTHLKAAVERLKDHPATLGYNIGNEMKRTEPASNGWFPQLDELARRAKTIDSLHVMTTSINHPQFFGFAGPVTPETAPNIDLWGLNFYSGARGYHDGLWDQIKAQDPTRPAWFSEFGADRYHCAPPQELFSCGADGSGEDAPAKAGWDTTQWDGIAAHLANADDPDGAVIGGTAFMWSDLWWFALALFTGTGTPATHDVGGVPGTNPVNGEPNHFARNNFPDGHVTVEWFGANQTMPLDAEGPRVTTVAFDRMAERYTGVARPVVSAATAAANGPCSATVSWTTDQPTYGRVDYGPERRVVVGTDVYQENFVAEEAAQGDGLATEHAFTIDDLEPGQTYLAYVRGFDEFGRAGSSNALVLTTPVGVCAP